MAEMLKASGLGAFEFDRVLAVNGYSSLHKGYDICDIMVVPCTVNRVSMYEVKTDNRAVVLSSESSVLVQSNGVEKLATILRLAKNLTSLPKLAVSTAVDEHKQEIVWEEIRSVLPIDIQDEECLRVRVFGVNHAVIVDSIFVK